MPTHTMNYRLTQTTGEGGLVVVELTPFGFTRPTYSGSGRTLALALESLARSVRSGEGVY